MKKSPRDGLIENMHCSIIDVDGASYFLQELDLLKIPLTEDETLMKEVIEESIEGIPPWAGAPLLGGGSVDDYEFPDNFFEELDDIRDGLVLSLELRGVI
jgi:hypothetical protein